MPPPTPLPATLYRNDRAGCWLLVVHGLDSLTLVADDAEARRTAAALLSRAQGRRVNPGRVRLSHREDPARTLQRIARNLDISLPELLTASRVPAPAE